MFYGKIADEENNSVGNPKHIMQKKAIFITSSKTPDNRKCTSNLFLFLSDVSSWFCNFIHYTGNYCVIFYKTKHSIFKHKYTTKQSVFDCVIKICSVLKKSVQCQPEVSVVVIIMDCNTITKLVCSNTSWVTRSFSLQGVLSNKQ